jgi:hypothetical protein
MTVNIRIILWRRSFHESSFPEKNPTMDALNHDPRIALWLITRRMIGDFIAAQRWNPAPFENEV